MWRGRLPHWRADEVTYYLTFRHRRALTDEERTVLYNQILRLDGRDLSIESLCVLAEDTELLVKQPSQQKSKRADLSKIVEKAKAQAGKRIISKTLERFPPFYEESYDRIVRDQAEFEEKLEAIMTSPERVGLSQDASQYHCLYISTSATL